MLVDAAFSCADFSCLLIFQKYIRLNKVFICRDLKKNLGYIFFLESICFGMQIYLGCIQFVPLKKSIFDTFYCLKW